MESEKLMVTKTMIPTLRCTAGWTLADFLRGDIRRLRESGKVEPGKPRRRDDDDEDDANTEVHGRLDPGQFFAAPFPEKRKRCKLGNPESAGASQKCPKMGPNKAKTPIAAKRPQVVGAEKSKTEFGTRNSLKVAASEAGEARKVELRKRGSNSVRGGSSGTQLHVVLKVEV